MNANSHDDEVPDDLGNRKAGALHALRGEGTPDPVAEAARDMKAMLEPIAESMAERHVWAAHAAQASEHLLARTPSLATDLERIADLADAYGDAMVRRFRRRFGG